MILFFVLIAKQSTRKRLNYQAKEVVLFVLLLLLSFIFSFVGGLGVLGVKSVVQTADLSIPLPILENKSNFFMNLIYLLIYNKFP